MIIVWLYSSSNTLKKQQKAFWVKWNFLIANRQILVQIAPNVVKQQLTERLTQLVVKIIETVT